MIQRNRVLEKLQQGKTVIGCQIRSGCAMVGEIYGAWGIDYAFIEGEHFAYTPDSVLAVVRGCECGGVEPFLRIPDHDPGKILQYLDMGVKGMIIPHCDNGEQARALMAAAKYAPQGERGFSNTSRATLYGTLPMEEYKKIANANTLMMPMIESKEAVEKIDEILAAKPDGLHMGPGDLSESYGVALNDKVLLDAMALVLKKATDAGVPVGIVAATPEEAICRIKDGYRMISYSSDLMLISGACRSAMEKIRTAL